jgi:hypothetical protein
MPQEKLIKSGQGAIDGLAQRGMITSSANPFWLHGENEVGTGVKALTAFGINTQCASATYTGGKVGETIPGGSGDHVPLPFGSSDFTLTPTYSGCLGSGFLRETIAMNGCDYVFHIEKQLLEATTCTT